MKINKIIPLVLTFALVFLGSTNKSFAQTNLTVSNKATATLVATCQLSSQNISFVFCHVNFTPANKLSSSYPK